MSRLRFTVPVVVAALALLAAPAAAHAAAGGVAEAPTAVTARAGVNQARVYWQPPASDGGAAVSGYTATSNPAGKTCSADGTVRYCDISGLTNGQPYTFTVTALNGNGTSGPSAASNAVTPAQDTKAPTLVSTSVSPKRVSSFGGTVVVDLHITDDLSGIRTPAGGFDANPAVEFVKNSGDQSVGFTRNTTRISGDMYDGIYEATVVIPSGTAIGAWDLQVFPIDDNAGNSTFFINDPGIVVGTATAPTAITATADSDRQVTVSWSPPADDGGNLITSYQVTASPGGTVYTTSNTTLTTSFATWPADTPVIFTVRAINAAGTSDPSTASAPLTVPAVAPNAPTISTTTPSDQSIAASWTAPAANGGAPITSYTATATPGAATCTTTATTCTITGLTNGTSYTIAVTATNTAGTSPASTPSAAATPRTVPSAPTLNTITAGNQTITATWTAPASNGGLPVTGYTATATPGGATCTITTATTCTITGLTNGTSYTVTVTATSAAGTSPASTPSAATTPRTVPSAPTLRTITAGNHTVTATWTAPNNGGASITTYTVTAAPGGTTCTTTATTCTITGLTNGTSYAVSVTATNQVGTGAASTTSTAVVPRASTTLRLTSATATVTYGAAITASGSLTAPGTVPHATVTLQYRHAGSSSSYTSFGSATTSTTGAVTFKTFKPKFSVQIRLIYATSGPYLGAISLTKIVTVQRGLTIAASTHSAKRGKTFTIKGVATPASPGRAITLQRKSGSRWTTVKTMKLTSKSAYSFATKNATKAKLVYRVTTASDANFGTSVSGTTTVTVS